MTSPLIPVESILAISIIIQAAAAVMAIRLIGITGRRAAWGLLAAAMALMAVRRIVPLYRLVTGDVSYPPDAMSETIGLALSAAMATGISQIAPLFMERKRALSEVQGLAAIVESSDDAIIAKDLGGTILSWNKGAERIYGYTAGETIGRNVSLLIPPEKSDDLGWILDVIASGGHISHYETQRIKKDGTQISMSLTVSPIKDPSGRITGASTIGRDITGRKLVEEANRLAGAYNRSLIEASLDPLVTIGPDGRITDVNAATEVATGRKRSELVGTDFSEYFTEPKEARSGYRQVFREGMVRDYPLEIRRSDGKTTPVLYNASVYRDEEGKVAGIFAAARDVTELKRAETERTQYYELFRNSNDIMVIADPNGAFLRVNPACVQALGYSEDELAAKPFVDFIHPDDKQRTVDEMAEQLQRGYSLNFENRYVCKDSSLRWLSWRATYNKAEGVTYATARDITERKQAEDEIRRLNEGLEKRVKERTLDLEKKSRELVDAQKALMNIVEDLGLKTTEIEQANVKLKELDRLKSMFIASMSHELRTPLNSIIGFTGIMLQGMAGEITEEQRRQHTMVKESARHLLALINDIIDISKIEAGKVEPCIEQFDLSALARDVAGSFSVAVENKGLRLSIDAPEKLAVESDERRIRQVLVNLVGNAVKFTDSGGVEIIITAKDGLAEIEVSDTGIGIKKQDLGRLFEAFSQVVGEGRPKEGSGLGLYLSRKIADLLGCNIHAESEFGKGSTFTMAMPLKYARAEA